MLLTQKIRIFPSEEQEHLLWIFSEKCRLIFNFALAERIQNWRANKKKPKEKRTYITYNDQSKALPLLKETYPEYTWVYSKVVQTTLKNSREIITPFFLSGKREIKKQDLQDLKGRSILLPFVIINLDLK